VAKRTFLFTCGYDLVTSALMSLYFCARNVAKDERLEGMDVLDVNDGVDKCEILVLHDRALSNVSQNFRLQRQI
jgi:hypothetical protein